MNSHRLSFRLLCIAMVFALLCNTVALSFADGEPAGSTEEALSNVQGGNGNMGSGDEAAVAVPQLQALQEVPQNGSDAMQDTTGLTQDTAGASQAVFSASNTDSDRQDVLDISQNKQQNIENSQANAGLTQDNINILENTTGSTQNTKNSNAVTSDMVTTSLDNQTKDPPINEIQTANEIGQEETTGNFEKSVQYIALENAVAALINSGYVGKSDSELINLPDAGRESLTKLLNTVSEAFAVVTESDEAFFISQNPDFLITLLRLQQALEGDNQPQEVDGEHGHDNVSFTPWTNGTALPTTPGNYYLDTDVTLKSNWIVTSGNTITICLNGHKIEQSGADRVIYVQANGVLNIYDCNGTNSVYHFTEEVVYGSGDNAAKVWKLTGDDSSLILEGGIITGGHPNKGFNNANIVNVNATGGGGINNAGELNLFGGNIVGNCVSYLDYPVFGGGVLNQKTGTFTMYDGTICGNCAYTKQNLTNNALRSYGGGVCSAGEFVMNGGDIYSNMIIQGSDGNTKQKVSGGGVAIINGSFTMSKAGRISNCSAPFGQGGGVYITGSDTKAWINGGIGYNSAGDGGGLYINSGTVNLSGFVVANTATEQGGGVDFAPGANLTVSGAVNISGNSAPKGANLFLNNAGGDVKLLVGSLGSTESTKANIGIYSGKLPASGEKIILTSGYKVNTGLEETSYFFPDNIGYTLKNIEGEIALTELVPITITLDPGDGQCSDLTLTATENGTLSALPTASKEGFEFLGWYTDAEGGELVTTATVFSGDTVIYAQYKANKEDRNPPAAADFTVTNESLSGKSDGSIVYNGENTSLLERQLTDGSWEAYYGGYNNLAPGDYVFRFKEDDNYNCSGTVTVTVGQGGSISITLPSNDEQTNYTITANPAVPDYGGSCIVVVTVKEGYGFDNGFGILVNGEKKTTKIYNDSGTSATFNITNITENLVIQVENIADFYAPEGKITISGNEFSNFGGQTGYLIFNADQQVTITASDSGSGVDKLYYLLRESQAFTFEEIATAEWTEYSSLTLAGEGSLFIYAKLVDNAGNVSYVSTKEIKIDKTAPTLTANGKLPESDGRIFIPKGDGELVITETNLKSVFLDDEDITKDISGGRYTVIYSEDITEHKIKIADEAGNEATFTLMYSREAPSIDDFDITDETVAGKNNGIISVKSPDGTLYELSPDGETWKSFSSSFDSLVPGVYKVRFAETGSYPPSESIELTVNKGRMLTVTLPGNQEGYTVEAEPAEVEYNGETTVTVTIKEGYTISGDRPVSADDNGTTGKTERDGNVITAQIINITGDTVISITPATDNVKPEIVITVGTETSKELNDTHTFDKFAKKFEANIKASDSASGVDKVYYFVAGKDYTKSSLENDSEIKWTEIQSNLFQSEGEKVNFDTEGKYILYVKVIDKAGNISFADFGGVVVDTTAPVLTIGELNYDDENVFTVPREDIIFIIEEENLESVELDGEDITGKLEDGTYTVEFDEEKEEYKVKLLDKAGNGTEYTVKYELPEPGVISLRVDIGNNTPLALIPSFDEESATNELSEDDLKALAKGKNISVFFTINGTSLNEIDKAVISSAVSNVLIGSVIDISLFKQIENEPPQAIHDAKEKYTISMKIPTELMTSDNSITRIFKLIRLHNGIAQVLPSTISNGTITFETDKFSSYVLGYSDIYHVKNIAVSPKSYTLIKAGETKQLAAAISPAGVTNRNIVWTSSNTDIATVSSKGVVTAVSNGQVTIKATAVDGGKSASCVVTVNLSYKTRYPRTGDSNNTNLYISAMAVSALGFGVGLYGLKKRRKKA